ncbi:MAG: hypothetical protein J5I92_09955 [Thiogranum sp.]|nr:hypothetical protein [Thiogranum sp.]
MSDRATQLQAQIDAVIKRLRKIQRGIAGSRQPASRLELAALEELGRDYARLQQQLQEWYATSQAGKTDHDRT